jgi:hypothetical protein
MRTYFNSVVTNGNVFGFGQGRVVSSQVDATCAPAAQHLESWHASKRNRSLRRLLKRRAAAVMAGAAPEVRQMCLAITGPQGWLARHTSPALVTA